MQQADVVMVKNLKLGNPFIYSVTFNKAVNSSCICVLTSSPRYSMVFVLPSASNGCRFSSSTACLALNLKKSISSAAASISAWTTVLPCDTKINTQHNKIALFYIEIFLTDKCVNCAPVMLYGLHSKCQFEFVQNWLWEKVTKGWTINQIQLYNVIESQLLQFSN